MKAASLIFSRQDDLNRVAAEWGLQQNGLRVIAGQSLADPAFAAWSVHTAGQSWNISPWLADLDLRSIWCHRPQRPQAGTGVHTDDRDFAQGEWQLFQKNVLTLARAAIDTLWVNDYAAAQHAENKLIQLRAARKLGIAFPETLVSNDPEQVREFAARHGRIVYKHFMPYGWKDTDGRHFRSEVTVMEGLHGVTDASIQVCPGIYQPYVNKVCDIRVTVIGQRCYAARIGRRGGDAFVDWRPHSMTAQLDAEVFALPAAYEAKLAALMRELGLTYGCIDLALDDRGELTFFEVNQTGQFLFVEEWLPQLPLLKSLCAMLAQGRTDYSLEAAAHISYARFCKTELFQSWQARQRASMSAMLQPA